MVMINKYIKIIVQVPMEFVLSSNYTAVTLHMITVDNPSVNRLINGVDVMPFEVIVLISTVKGIKYVLQYIIF